MIWTELGHGTWGGSQESFESETRELWEMVWEGRLGDPFLKGQREKCC